MLKKLLSILLLLLLLTTALPTMAEAVFEGNPQLMYDAIRWNLNLPKQATIVRAEEYSVELSKAVTLHALLMEVAVTPEMEMMYGMASKIVVIDLDTGDLLDYKTFDGNVMWPEGEVTDKTEALNLLFNGYWSYLEGYNQIIMTDREEIISIPEEDIQAVNDALKAVFIR